MVYMDEILCHLINICPFPHTMSNSVADETTTSSDDEMCIPVTKNEDSHSTLVDSNQSSDSDDNEGQQIVTGLPQEASAPAKPLL